MTVCPLFAYWTILNIQVNIRYQGKTSFEGLPLELPGTRPKQPSTNEKALKNKEKFNVHTREEKICINLEKKKNRNTKDGRNCDRFYFVRKIRILKV